MAKKEIFKIGRYYYERIPKDKDGEAKLKDGEEMWNTYWLVCDGEDLEAFRRVKKTNLGVETKKQERERILGLLDDWNGSSRHIHNTNHVSEEILDKLRRKINSEKAEKTCATKHVIPPKHKCSGILPNLT